MRLSGLGVSALAIALLASCDKPSAVTSNNVTAAAATATVAGKNWLEVFAETPEGGFRIGNPDAKVKLVEYASLTCPHCRDFHDESDAMLRSKYISTGKVSYEYRNFLLNGPDYAASLLARCEGPQAFFNLMNAFYAAQLQWTEPFSKLSPEDSKRLAALPTDQQISGLAKAGGLDTFMRARGMTAARFDQCTTDPKAIKRLADIRDEAVSKYQINGTPSFLINGVVQKDILTWPTLEPKLESAMQ